MGNTQEVAWKVGMGTEDSLRIDDTCIRSRKMSSMFSDIILELKINHGGYMGIFSPWKSAHTTNQGLIYCFFFFF